jgi:spore germination protein KC
MKGWEIKAIRLILLSALFVLMAGCSAKDIDKRYFVVSVGIDKGENGTVKVSTKLAIPKGILRHGDSDFIMMSLQDATIEGAMNRIRTLTDKELDFGHMKLVVFGEEVAKEGVLSYLDWLQRSFDIQEICWLAVGKPSANEVLAFRPRSERYPSNNLFLTFDRTGTQSDLAVTQYLYSFYRELTEEGIDPMLPVITLVEQGMTIDHAAVFRGDKLLFHLTPDETRVMNHMHTNTPTIEWVVHFDKDDPLKHAVLIGHKNRSSFQITESPEPTIRFRFNVKGILGELQPNQKLTGENRGKVEAKLADKINRVAETLLVKLQKADADPVGFGLRYRARHWDNTAAELRAWQSLYPRARFDISTQVEIRSTGNMK